jgi:protein involved in polysaccharide export with SLBB domain
MKSTPGTEFVTISVKAWKSYKFTIQGEVGRQGVYSSEGFVTIADAIAMAGGLSRFVKQREIKIFRADPDDQEDAHDPDRLRPDRVGQAARLEHLGPGRRRDLGAVAAKIGPQVGFDR